MNIEDIEVGRKYFFREFFKNAIEAEVLLIHRHTNEVTVRTCAGWTYVWEIERALGPVPVPERRFKLFLRRLLGAL